MSEYSEQVAVFDYAEKHKNTWPELGYLFHIPNGGFRDIVTASRLKRAGVKKGVPDMFLPVSNHLWRGLWVEMKTGGGKLSTEQAYWQGFLERQGYRAIVCRSAAEAIKEIESYLRLKR